jgi:tetratricopeptide (TPR) repeat protein
MSTNDTSLETGKPVSLSQRLEDLTDRQCLLVVAGVAFALFANSLTNGFAYDDELIVQNNTLIRSLGNFVKFFTTGYWQEFFGGTANYRPLFVLSLAVDHAIWKENPFGYHLSNVLLHVAVCLLFFKIARQYELDRKLALLASLFFAAHPVHTEAVANVVGRMELLGTLFCGLTWFVWKSDRIPSPARILLAGVFFLCALFSKENYLVFPAVLFVAEMFSKKSGPDWPNRMRRAIPFAVFAASTGLYLVCRRLSGQAVGSPTASRTPLSGYGFGERLSAMGSASLEWYRLLVIGFPLKPMYDQFNVELPRHPDLRTWIGWFVFVTLCALAVAGFRRFPLVSFAIFFWFVTLSIVSNIPFPIGAVIGERWLYLPSVAFCLILAFGLLKFRQALIENRRIDTSSPLISILCVALLASYGLGTVLRNPDWKDSQALFRKMIRTDPRHPFPYALVAEFEMDRNPGEARELLEVGDREIPGHVEIVRVLAKLDFREERNAEAEKLLKLILATEPPDLPPPAVDWSQVHALHSAVLFQRGAIPEAQKELEISLRLAPKQYSEALFASRVLFKQGKNAEGVLMLEAVARSNPEVAQIQNNLGVGLLRLNRFPEAKAAFEKALSINPDYVQAKQNLALVLEKMAAVENNRSVSQ